ncbi:hypothetical protein [Dyadobacter psychrophilus]|uniref:DUF4249 domain-containing protein n=1 Tax=Dyadobacter psychrophilus TaxID=651661 RepID=A0A1T5HBY1_9BACT|nr:hypothetical protein [Dyadobacter psychrophilus]SKC18225.1 hypothetical protein SAMN05660293_05287 [Dyadobacter psychrophilus]
MKRISLHFSALLAALFLFAFSCQDHYVPEEPEQETPVEAPKVQTVALSIENESEYRYKLNVESLGNVHITGYGIAFSVEFDSNAPFTNTPTIADNNVVFSMPISTGEKFKIDGAFPGSYKTIYYRAYITYGVNSVAYGDVMEISPVPLEKAIIQTREYLKNGSITEYRVFFEKLGDIRISEYGILLNIKESENDSDFSVEPVIGKHDKKLPFSSIVTKEGLQSLIIDDPESLNYHQRYYRAYAILENGSIVYGSVMGLD